MDILHPEESVSVIKDGHKFTTYKDSYIENLGEFRCPCCNNKMGGV